MELFIGQKVVIAREYIEHEGYLHNLYLTKEEACESYKKYGGNSNNPNHFSIVDTGKIVSSDSDNYHFYINLNNSNNSNKTVIINKFKAIVGGTL